MRSVRHRGWISPWVAALVAASCGGDDPAPRGAVETGLPDATGADVDGADTTVEDGSSSDTAPSDAGEADAVEGPRWVPVVEALRQVVPSDGIPSTVVMQNANNNLDILRHGGRLFFAFRTAPKHYASEKTEMFVLSTTDEVTWTHEATIALGRDVREPRFLAIGDRLFLYFAVLGVNATDFTPAGMKGMERRADGTWTPPEDSYLPTFIPWRARVVDGRPMLIGYTGGENVYEADGEPVQIHVLTTTDGRTWSPYWEESGAVVLTGGGSEADLAFREDGSVIAVVRNEAGDESGFGSKVCRGEAATPWAWHCESDPRKYDSPLVFRHGGATWLIGRRNVTETGNYDLGLDDLTMEGRYWKYQYAYWNEPKRCSLWRVDEESLRVAHVVDLPGLGDTCFASAEAVDEGSYLVYNYTSPLDGRDVTWVQGQNGRTQIWRMVLRFVEEER